MAKQLAARVQALGGRVRTKHLCVLVAAATLLSLLPLLYIAQYSYPIQDDFAFGAATRQVFLQSGSLWQTLRAAAAVSAEFYTTWQGSYAACFLFALQPGIFGTAGYAATTYLMLLSLLAGTYSFVYVALRRLLGAGRWQAGLAGWVLCFICVQQVPNGNQSFYWYNGAVYYTFFHGLMLLLLALVMWYATAPVGKRRIAFGITLPLALVVAGGNYVSGLVCVLALGFIVLVCVLRGNKRWKWLCVPTMLLAAGFAVSMAAPGNAVRQAGESGAPGFVRGILQAFAAVFATGSGWCFWFVGLLLAFLAPLFWRIAGGARFRFRLPGLASLGSVCLLAAALFPHIYATGGTGPDRLVNIVFFLFVLLCAGNLLYWLGWLRGRLGAKEQNAPARVDAFCRRNALPALALCLCIGAALLVLPGRLNKPLTTMEAVSQLRSGEAARFGAEMKQRYTAAENAAGERLVVPPITAAPGLLAYGRIYDDATMWDNEIFAEYFGLVSVVEE